MIKFSNVESQLQIDGAFKVEVQGTKAESIATTHGGINHEESVILQKAYNNNAEEPLTKRKPSDSALTAVKN